MNSVTATVMARAPHAADAAPIGVISEIQGPVVVISCDELPPLRRALVATIDGDSFVFEVHQHLDEHHVRAITLHRSGGLYRGLQVRDTGAPLHVPVTAECLGRLLNAFGEPLDGEPPLEAEAYRNIHAEPPPLSESVGTGDVL